MREILSTVNCQLSTPVNFFKMISHYNNGYNLIISSSHKFHFHVYNIDTPSRSRSRSTPDARSRPHKYHIFYITHTHTCNHDDAPTSYSYPPPPSISIHCPCYQHTSCINTYHQITHVSQCRIGRYGSRRS